MAMRMSVKMLERKLKQINKILEDMGREEQLEYQSRDSAHAIDLYIGTACQRYLVIDTIRLV